MNIKMAYFTNQEKFFNLLIKKFYQNEWCKKNFRSYGFLSRADDERKILWAKFWLLGILEVTFHICLSNRNDCSHVNIRKVKILYILFSFLLIIGLFRFGLTKIRLGPCRIGHAPDLFKNNFFKVYYNYSQFTRENYFVVSSLPC